MSSGVSSPSRCQCLCLGECSLPYYPAGKPLDHSLQFDAELVEGVIARMNRGKAAGLDGVTAEHLQYCHSLLPCVLAKLFNLMIAIGHVPARFGHSYMVPLLKSGVKLC